MKIIFLFFLSLSVFADKVPLSDVALVRLNGKVIFYSEMQNQLKSFKKLECISSKSLLFQSLKNFDKFDIGNLPHEWRANREIIEKLILFEKIKAFGLTTRSLNILESLNFLKSINGCQKIVLDEDELVSFEILRIELYLRQKFISRGKTLSTNMNSFVETISSKSSHEFLF